MYSNNILIKEISPILDSWEIGKFCFRSHHSSSHFYYSYIFIIAYDLPVKLIIKITIELFLFIKINISQNSGLSNV